MISRALLVALFSAFVTSLAPITAPADDNCALYLTGPGRSSAYDYSLNLLKGNFEIFNLYDLGQLYQSDTKLILLKGKGASHWCKGVSHWFSKPVILNVSYFNSYGLTYEEIEKGLPLIDTSRTLIREVCPPVFSHVEC
ncbi:unnamed protein product [Leptidea sinapis]|uniref:Uncharacterized protein n=1 Tax=Leptidea sinapis TaxID=189913 RepID=A0A5E4PU09_9NEOP|nr:unnamed protein product [Leptidea sinapis]